MAGKLTLKNTMVYDFMRRSIPSNHLNISVKDVYRKNQAEIAEKFNINTYATFNMHVRKCMEWERATGKKVSV